MNGRAYATRPADLAQDRQRILELWREGLPQNGAPEAKLDWYYRRNPHGEPAVLLLLHAARDEAVGVASVVPKRILLRDRIITAGVLVDFVVQRQHRNFFAARKLQADLRRRAEERHPLLLALPNARSEAVLRRLGYGCVGQLHRHVRILRSARYLARGLPAGFSNLAGPLLDRFRMAAMPRPGGDELATGWLDAPDARFDRLWAAAAARRPVMGVRDREFLHWRFVECPLYAARFFTVTAADGDLLAYAACAAGRESLDVLDFLVAPRAPRAGRRLWRDLSREGFRLGYERLGVEFLGDARTCDSLRAAGLLRREGRPLLAAGGAARLLEGAGCYVTGADEDA